MNGPRWFIPLKAGNRPYGMWWISCSTVYGKIFPCQAPENETAYFFVNISPKFTIPGLICPPITLTKSPLLFRMTARINAYYGELKIDCQRKKLLPENYNQLSHRDITQ
jgi:hypothetical protein